MEENNKLKYKENKLREIVGLVYLVLAIFLGIAFYIPGVHGGPLGQFFVNLGKGLIGPIAYVLPLIFLVLSVATFLEDFFKKNKIRIQNLFILIVLISALMHVITVDADVIAVLSVDVENNPSVLQSIGTLWSVSQSPDSFSGLEGSFPGGIIGGSIALGLARIIGSAGTITILVAMIIIEAIIIGNFSISKILITIVAAFYAITEWFKNILASNKKEDINVESTPSRPSRTAVPVEDRNASIYNRGSSNSLFPEENPDYTINGVTQEELRRQTASQQRRRVQSFDIDAQSVPSRDPNLLTPNFLINGADNIGTQAVQTQTQGRMSNASARQQSGSFFDIEDYDEEHSNDFLIDSNDGEEIVFDFDDVDDSAGFILDDESKTSHAELARAAVKPVKPSRTTQNEKLATPSRQVSPEKQIQQTQDRTPKRTISKAEAEAVTSSKRRGDRPYEFPPLTLLEPRPVVQKGSTARIIQEQAHKLEATLKSFGVDAKVINITTGPSITRFELRPGAGVKISRIVNLSDDIALSLAATTVRIEAPIPGKSAIGIEIPNRQTALVGLRSLIEDKDYQKRPEKILVPLGRDIPGQAIYSDLQKMPHLLIAGATGSGKSISINTILMSLLYRCSPEELRLLLIDPKVVELSIYNGIPHLLAPVITDPAKAANTLNWLVQEMERRYQLFAEKKARDMAGYNELMEKHDGDKLPYIVLIIDELSDLMMTSPKEVEDSISRLTAMARAAGIHLIIATQRPSVDVITGVIKANIPSRVAFAVSSQVDSRTILDGAGAEKLLGKGDMLYFPQSASKPIRGQGAFVDDHEVQAVIEFLKAQGLDTFDQNVAKEIVSTKASASLNSNDDEEEDEYFEEAVDIIVDNGYASVSLLQRRLNVGYPRAGRLIDSMESRGYIGPHAGSKPRDVILSPEEWALIKAGAWNDAAGEIEGDDYVNENNQW